MLLFSTPYTLLSSTLPTPSVSSAQHRREKKKKNVDGTRLHVGKTTDVVTVVLQVRALGQRVPVPDVLPSGPSEKEEHQTGVNSQASVAS